MKANDNYLKLNKSRERTRFLFLDFFFLFMLICLTIAKSDPVEALTFALPQDGDMIGSIQMTTVRKGESLGDIGRRYDVGVYEMIEANPKVDPWVPKSGSVVVVPTQYILPSGPRKGIVINLAEMRLYYYHSDKPLVTTCPLGIGKKGWETPCIVSTIVEKKKDPVWVPPPSIRAEHLAKGDPLPAVVKAGPDNPMGRHALYLAGGSSIRIHGTNKRAGIGVRGSHGCIRLLPEDIEYLYHSVPIGTSVRIIHEPYKVGWYKNRLYLEAHEPLSEPRYRGSDNVDNLVRAIQRAIRGKYVVNWASAQLAAKTRNGYPTRID